VSLTTKIRDPFSAISHFIGAAAALIGSCWLLLQSGGSPIKIVAFIIYGLSLVALFSASGVYHSVIAQPRTITILRKIDHSAIYLLIAGSYTPFCLIAFQGFWHWGLLAIIWSLALAGIVVKVFIINTPRWITAGLYVLMGWLSVFAVQEFLLRLPPQSFGWLLAGGILYTLGAVIYITKKGNFFPGVFGFHELWHVFVLLGAAAHFVAVTTIL
jgi:hemolysin III